MKKILSIALSIGMCLSMLAFAACGGNGGDGKTSCKNCGRSSVYALGFCKSCYKDFHEFTYGDD